MLVEYIIKYKKGKEIKEDIMYSSYEDGQYTIYHAKNGRFKKVLTENVISIENYIEYNYEVKVEFTTIPETKLYDLKVDGNDTMFSTLDDVENALVFVINCAESK